MTKIFAISCIRAFSARGYILTYTAAVGVHAVNRGNDRLFHGVKRKIANNDYRRGSQIGLRLRTIEC